MGGRSDDSVHGAGGDRPGRYASVADRRSQAFWRCLAACLRRHNVLEYLVDNVGAWLGLTGYDYDTSSHTSHKEHTDSFLVGPKGNGVP